MKVFAFVSLATSKPFEPLWHWAKNVSRGYIVRCSVVASSLYSSFECKRWKMCA